MFIPAQVQNPESSPDVLEIGGDSELTRVSHYPLRTQSKELDRFMLYKRCICQQGRDHSSVQWFLYFANTNFHKACDKWQANERKNMTLHEGKRAGHLIFLEVEQHQIMDLNLPNDPQAFSI